MIVVQKTGVLFLTTLAAFLSAGAASKNFEDKRGLALKTLSPQKVEGEYYGETGYIQFSSKVRGDDHSFTVTTSTAERDGNILSIKKSEKASMMTMKLGQTKLLIQMNQPGSGLPHSEYVVPQAFHNLVDSALNQNFVFRALIQQLDSQNANEARRRAIEDLAMCSQANSIIEAAKVLGNAGVMGTDNPAAQQFYVIAMRLAKIKDMIKRGAVATSDDTVPVQHSFHHMHSMYAYSEQETCPECTTGRCPYMGDQSNECNGMCGLRCGCWSWVCGDCCVHQGCLDHDNCCTKHGYMSPACLAPVGFKCSGYSC